MTARAAAPVLAIGAWWCLLMAALVAAAGPIGFAPIGLSVSGPARPVVAAVALGVVAWWLRGPRHILHDLADARGIFHATGAFAAALLAGRLLAQGSVSVGGADSAGYLAQAALWNTGRLRVPPPLAIPDLAQPASVQSGLGFRPDPSGRAIVPSYPPGLPWLQAAAIRIGGEPAAVRGLPLCAALVTLLAAWMLARAHAGPAGAAIVVLAVSSLPPFLFQALQPMSDVPALAGWLLALALATRPGGGALAGSAVATLVAITIRPNLAPLAAAVCWQAALTQRAAVNRWRAPAAVAAAACLAAALVAAVQAYLYGSPMQSGYGPTSDLFALAHASPNVLRYWAWLLEAVSWPTLLLIAAGGVALVTRAVHHANARPMLLMVVLTLAAYLFYVPFDSWTYLRFVLVALAMLPIGAAGAVERAVRQAGPGGLVVFAALVLLIAIPNVQRARTLGVFDIRAREYRYEAAGRFVHAHLSADGLIVAAQHSTSAAYYGRRPVVRADLLDPPAWAAVSAWATRQGRPIAFVLDAVEIEMVQERLGADGRLALDWPPRAAVGRPVHTQVWIDTDRDGYRNGHGVPTTRLLAVP